MAETRILRMNPLSPPESFADTVKLWDIRYLSGGCEVEGYMALPADLREPAPLVIFNRGGNREFATLRPEAVCRYAANGYAAAGSQYRGNAGGTGQEEFGGRDVEDVLQLADICLAMEQVRKEGYYMAGHSRGGMMTYLCCARDGRIRAAVIGAGLADCVRMYRDREDSMKQVFHELVGGSPEEMPEAYAARSAVCFAERILCPILICQGTDDWRVSPEQALEMDRQLEHFHKEHRLIIYPGADHSLKGTTYLEDTLAWFAAHPL